jgi:hypothetical protein
MSQNSSRPSAGDPEKIVAGIEQARKDLSDSVQALAAKVDVPSRMKDTAGRAREQLGGTLATLNRTAREKAPHVRDRVAASLGKAGHTLEKAGQKLPEPARSTAVRTTRQATDVAGKRPRAVAAVAGACAAAGLLLWRRKRR